LQSWFCFDIPNGAEQAHNDIELTVQIEIYHVALLKAKARVIPAGDREHIPIDIQPLDAVVPTQQVCVNSRSTSNIEQCIPL
jgi:hypothetical protein